METTEKLLITRATIMKMLGIGEEKFKKLELPYIKIPGAKRRLYIKDEIINYINQYKVEAKCPSLKERARPSGVKISRSNVIDFEEALKQTTVRPHKT